MNSSSIGSIRTVNKRGDPEFKPEKDELIIEIDRPSGSVLQNRHPMLNKTMQERERVIKLNYADMVQDIERQGEMHRELHRIAKLVFDGNKVVLMCWCNPLPCHGDHYVKKIYQIVKEMQKNN
jgi:hypothetical protein